MNPETALELVAALMSKREQSISGRWAVVNRNGKFLCLPVEQTEPMEYEYGRYNQDDLTMGLSIRQWAKLSCRIQEYLTEKGL